jgi:hypothetical protein
MDLPSDVAKLFDASVDFSSTIVGGFISVVPGAFFPEE